MCGNFTLIAFRKVIEKLREMMPNVTTIINGSDTVYIETRMSKGSSGWFFSHFFLLSGGFLSVIVGKKRETRHLKAETLGF